MLVAARSWRGAAALTVSSGVLRELRGLPRRRTRERLLISSQRAQTWIVFSPSKLWILHVRDGIPVRAGETPLRKRHHRLRVAQKPVHRRLGARQLHRLDALGILRNRRTYSSFLQHLYCRRTIPEQRGEPRQNLVLRPPHIGRLIRIVRHPLLQAPGGIRQRPRAHVISARREQFGLLRIEVHTIERGARRERRQRSSGELILERCVTAPQELSIACTHSAPARSQL